MGKRPRSEGLQVTEAEIPFSGSKSSRAKLKV